MRGRAARLPGPPRSRLPIAALFAAATAAAFLTARDYGVVSDVANYFHSSRLQIAWAGRLLETLAGGGAAEVLSRDTVLEHWRWLPSRVPHPPLSRELGGLSWLALGRWLDPLTAYRGATMIAYGALVASLAAVTAGGTGSRLAGLAAAAAALFTPALFAHGHFAHTDGILTAFWFGCVAFAEAYRRWGDERSLAACGLLLGAACATKFTGVLLVPVLAVWLGANRRLEVRSATILTAAGAVVFFAVDPGLWVAPLQGLREYVANGLARSSGEATRIATEYFGRVYTFRPPWHYPFVWTAIVFPLPILGSALLGLAAWRRQALVRLAILNVGVVYAALLLPAAPLHDGIRLFLPAFPFWCVLAGIGCAELARLVRRLPPAGRTTEDLTAALVLVGLFALPALRTVQYHPHQLSYFNALVGGVRGAEARGLEVTNLKETLSPEVLEELEPGIPEGAVVHGGFLTEELCFYQAVGEAPRGWVVETELVLRGRGHTLVCGGPEGWTTVAVPRPAREPDFVFVLRRPAQHTRLETALERFGGAPFYELAVRGVPLLRVYRTR